jgi:hypothetical protein
MQAQLDNTIIGKIDHLYHSLSLFADLLSLSPPNGTNESNAILNVRRLYASCVNEETIEVDGVDTILAFMNTELGGWPVWQGSAWVNSTFNFSRLLLKLYEYNSNVIYNAGTGIYDMNSSAYIIRVSKQL